MANWTKDVVQDGTGLTYSVLCTKGLLPDGRQYSFAVDTRLIKEAPAELAERELAKFIAERASD